MTTKEALKILFFQNGRSQEGYFYNSSPGLLPMIDDVRKKGFDISFYKDEELFLKDCVDSGADVIAISAIERTLFQSVELAKKVRSIGYSGIVMIGGNTLKPYLEDLIQEIFDIVVGEESELIFPSILYQIAIWKQKKPNKKDIKCVEYFPSIVTERKVGEKGGALDGKAIKIISQAYFTRVDYKIGVSEICIRNGKTGSIYRFYPPESKSQNNHPTFNCLPEDYELEQTFSIPWDIIKKNKWTTLEIFGQRGCPWGRCIFCSMRKSVVRALSNKTILSTIENAKNHGIPRISFSDDMFVQKIGRTRELVKSISEMNTGIRFRAQTTPSRSIWGLLESISRAGFDELCFGVETLNANRAEFLGKTSNGERYLQEAKETILRTATAGIVPILYMILIDPRSTLSEIASDLLKGIELLSNVYNKTSVLPMLSWSLVLLPISNGMLGKDYLYSTTTANLGKRSFQIPFEYYFPDVLVKFIEKVKQNTNNLPLSRDSYETLKGLMVALKDIAEEYGEGGIFKQMTQGLKKHMMLRKALLKDILATAQDIVLLPNQKNPMWWLETSSLRYNFHRFASFSEGMTKYVEVLQSYTKN